MRKPNLAFITASAAEDVAGSEDVLCLQLAQRLRPYADIEVLTTCARDRMTWRNHYAPGHVSVDQIHVQRFPVDGQRNAASFERAAHRLRDRVAPTVREQEAWVRAGGPLSTALAEYVRVHERRFESFAFFGYFFALTYFTLPLVERKAVLWPLAHDDWPLGLSIWNRFFQRPRHIVFGSVEEQQVFARRFPASTTPADLVTTGVLVPPADAVRFRDRYDINGPFALCVLRNEDQEGLRIVVDHFAKYRAAASMPRKLVIIGDVSLALPHEAGLVVLGGISEGSAWDALAAADLAVLPSPSGNLAAMLEAWACGKPVLVNAAAPGMVGQCRRAKGGLWFSNGDEFTAALELLTTELGTRLGAQGRRFIETHHAWEDAVSAYRRILGC